MVWTLSCSLTFGALSPLPRRRGARRLCAHIRTMARAGSRFVARAGEKPRGRGSGREDGEQPRLRRRGDGALQMALELRPDEACGVIGVLLRVPQHRQPRLAIIRSEEHGVLASGLLLD